jgi:hypothetical protein
MKRLRHEEEGRPTAQKNTRIFTAGHQRLMPIILATQEAEIRRITEKPARINSS